jgi:membrane-bound inhibitor of C-type lysozyme
MKTYITFSILIFTFSSSLLFANNSELVDVSRCLEEQLTASAWSVTSNEQWEFVSDGTLLVFDQASQILQQGGWSLQTTEKELILKVMVGPEVKNYTLTPHCNQENIVLKDFATGELVMVPLRYDATLTRSLTGDWQKGFYGEEPFLAFKADGTYVVTDITKDHYELRTGHWSLMGNSLLLHNEEGEVQAFLIKHLQMDELVLSPFNANREDWYLNKL